jgi:RimJ/RimL family protein N-acetyltransferase
VQTAGAIPLTDGVVVLRRLRPGDRAAVLETMRDPLVRRWFNMPAEPSELDFEAVLADVRAGWERGDRFDFAVAEAPDGPAVGGVIASVRARNNWELAYLAGPRGRGRGLMTRAARLVVDWAFAGGARRLEIRAHPDNAESQRFAERLGFVREGRERRSIWLHGERCDAIVYSLLPEDPR